MKELVAWWRWRGAARTATRAPPCADGARSSACERVARASPRVCFPTPGSTRTRRRGGGRGRARGRERKTLEVLTERESAFIRPPQFFLRAPSAALLCSASFVPSRTLTLIPALVFVRAGRNKPRGSSSQPLAHTNTHTTLGHYYHTLTPHSLTHSLTHPLTHVSSFVRSFVR